MTLSQTWFEQAKKIIPGGVNSPVRAFNHVGGTPLYFSRASGPYLEDVDGRQYIDFCLGFGPHILGHSPAIVVKALQEQAALGTSLGACHPQEVRLASNILKGYPFLEQVRLVNSGTEAVMTAIRLARAFTNRSKVMKFEGCYHGHSDGLLAKAGSGVASLCESSSKGVPSSIVSETVIVRLDSWESITSAFELIGNDLAAVIIEPIPANHGLWVPPRSLLEKIMDFAKTQGALVIFDEVISGFRLSLHGACGYFDLKPDLVTLGKIIGGGLPLAAIAGRAHVMQNLAPLGNAYQAGTLSGNSLATAAGNAALEYLLAESPYEDLSENTRWFSAQVREMLTSKWPVHVESIGSLFWIYLDETPAHFPAELSADSRERFREFFHSCLVQGIYLPPSPYEVCFLSVAHTRDVLNAALEKLARALL